MDFELFEAEEPENTDSILNNGCGLTCICLLGAIVVVLLGTLFPVLLAILLLGPLILGAPVFWAIRIFKMWRAKNIFFPPEMQDALRNVLREHRNWNSTKVQNWLSKEHNLLISKNEARYWTWKIRNEFKREKERQIERETTTKSAEHREFDLVASDLLPILTVFGFLWAIGTAVVSEWLHIASWLAAILAVLMIGVAALLFFGFILLLGYIHDKVEGWVE